MISRSAVSFARFALPLLRYTTFYTTPHVGLIYGALFITPHVYHVLFRSRFVVDFTHSTYVCSRFTYTHSLRYGFALPHFTFTCTTAFASGVTYVPRVHRYRCTFVYSTFRSVTLSLRYRDYGYTHVHVVVRSLPHVYLHAHYYTYTYLLLISLCLLPVLQFPFTFLPVHTRYVVLRTIFHYRTAHTILYAVVVSCRCLLRLFCSLVTLRSLIPLPHDLDVLHILHTPRSLALHTCGVPRLPPVVAVGFITDVSHLRCLIPRLPLRYVTFVLPADVTRFACYYYTPTLLRRLFPATFPTALFVAFTPDFALPSIYVCYHIYALPAISDSGYDLRYTPFRLFDSAVPRFRRWLRYVPRSLRTFYDFR